jgi:hypothetical protein
MRNFLCRCCQYIRRFFGYFTKQFKNSLAPQGDSLPASSFRLSDSNKFWAGIGLLFGLAAPLIGKNLPVTASFLLIALWCITSSVWTRLKGRGQPRIVVTIVVAVGVGTVASFLSRELRPQDNGLCYYWLTHRGDQGFAEIRVRDADSARNIAVNVIDGDACKGMSIDEMIASVPAWFRAVSVPEIIKRGQVVRDVLWQQSKSTDYSDYSISFRGPYRDCDQFLLRKKIDGKWRVATKIRCNDGAGYEQVDDKFPQDIVAQKFSELDAAPQGSPVGYIDVMPKEAAVGAEIELAGWAADLEDQAPVASVSIFVGGKKLGEGDELGNERPDVMAWRIRPGWLNSGWHARVELNIAPGRYKVRVEAHSQHGNRNDLAHGQNVPEEIEVKAPNPQP